MRLVCPNCGAQYEVDDSVIPEGGRDVQCSACGHAWYQMPISPEVAEESSGGEHPVPAAVDTDGLDADSDDSLVDEKPEPEVPPREVDEGVRSILQEEAERELAARADDVVREPDTVETQPDLGLDDAHPSPEEQRRQIARERMARMRAMSDEDLPTPDFDAHSADAESEPDTDSARAHGRDLFPDIEEINSTLDRHGEGEDAAAPGSASAKSSSGFGRGFVLTLIVAIVLLTLYLMAPRIGDSIPALKPVLAAYVDAVNAARAWLDGTLRGLISKMDNMAGEG